MLVGFQAPGMAMGKQRLSAGRLEWFGVAAAGGTERASLARWTPRQDRRRARPPPYDRYSACPSSKRQGLPICPHGEYWSYIAIWAAPKRQCLPIWLGERASILTELERRMRHKDLRKMGISGTQSIQVYSVQSGPLSPLTVESCLPREEAVTPPRVGSHRQGNA